jgi:hypothetical protein
MPIGAQAQGNRHKQRPMRESTASGARKAGAGAHQAAVRSPAGTDSAEGIALANEAGGCTQFNMGDNKGDFSHACASLNGDNCSFKLYYRKPCVVKGQRRLSEGHDGFDGGFSGVAMGSHTRNVEPAPGLLCTSTLPPCCCTIFWTIASPSPVPPRWNCFPL